MADNKNGNGFKIAFWVMTVIATVGLVGVINAVIANDRLRASEDKEICATVKVEDDKIRSDFLFAMNRICDENKADRDRISERLEKMGNDITAIKTELKIKDNTRSR